MPDLAIVLPEGHAMQRHRWWGQRDASDRAAAVFATAQAIRHDDEDRRDRLVHYLRLFGQRDLLGLDPGNAASDDHALVDEERLRYNAVRAVINTAVARVGKNKPKARILTEGATWSMRRLADRATQYVAGVFHEVDHYRKARVEFRDACVGGSGVRRWYPRRTKNGWRVWCDRVFPWEVLVDRQDGRYGEPQAIYQYRWVDRDVLFQTYAKTARWDVKGGASRLREIVRGASEAFSPFGEPPVDSESDQALLIEAWHLPSGPDADDGWYSASVSTGELYGETWDEEWLPFSVYHWSKPLIGFWGDALTRDIQGIQVEINRLLDKIQRAYHLLGAPWVSVHRGARVIRAQWHNGIGRILEWEGGIEPRIHTAEPIHGGIFQHLHQLKMEAFELPGVGQTAALNRKPTDLESGEALRQWNDIEDTRLSDPALEYESYHMDCAEKVLLLSARMHRQKRTPHVMSVRERRRTRRWVEMIDFGRLADLTANAFAVQMFPESMLPSTPSGRTARIEGWLQAGLVDLEEARLLLEMPDLHEHTSLRLADAELVLDALERMLDDDDPPEEVPVPEPYQDPTYARRLCTAALLRAKLEGVPDDRLDLVDRYLQMVDRIVQIREGALPGMAGDVQQAEQAQQIAAATAAGADIQLQGGLGAPPALPGAAAPPMPPGMLQ